MKKNLLFLLIQVVFSVAASAQCATPNDDFSTTGAGGLLLGAPIYNADVNINTAVYAGSFTDVSKVVSGRTYSVTTSIAGDNVQVYQSGSQLAAGTSLPLSFTAASNADIRVYVCGNDGSFTRRLIMKCTSCSAPPSAPPAGNNLCANAVSATISANYTPGTPTFVANTTNGASEVSPICSGSSLGLDDIWYTFTTTGPFYLRHDNMSPTVMLAGNSPSVLLGSAIYSACPVANTTPVALCALTTSMANGNQRTFAGLAAGTYKLRLWANTANANINTNVFLYYSPVIPVELVDFKAKYTTKDNQLTWTTATERNVERFDIQRSNDGVTNWQSIGSAKAKGNSNALSSYQFADETPFRTSYYRLNTIDADGKTDVSKIVSINRQNNGKLTLTKAISSLYTEGSLLELNVNSEKTGTITTVLTDALGRVMLTKSDATNGGDIQIQMPTNGLAKGVYILNLTDGESRITTKIVKQ